MQLIHLLLLLGASGLTVGSSRVTHPLSADEVLQVLRAADLLDAIPAGHEVIGDGLLVLDGDESVTAANPHGARFLHHLFGGHAYNQVCFGSAQKHRMELASSGATVRQTQAATIPIAYTPSMSYAPPSPSAGAAAPPPAAPSPPPSWPFPSNYPSLAPPNTASPAPSPASTPPSPPAGPPPTPLPPPPNALPTPTVVPTALPTAVPPPTAVLTPTAVPTPLLPAPPSYVPPSVVYPPLTPTATTAAPSPPMHCINLKKKLIK